MRTDVQTDMTRLIVAFAILRIRVKMYQAAGRAHCPCEGFIDRGLLCDILLIWAQYVTYL